MLSLPLLAFVVLNVYHLHLYTVVDTVVTKRLHHNGSQWFVSASLLFPPILLLLLKKKKKTGDECCQAGEEEEVNDQRVKCLNNLATAQLKLEQFDEALHTSRDVLFLDPLNVKALFRAGKVCHSLHVDLWPFIELTLELFKVAKKSIRFDLCF